jgi:hypothetical protein
VTDTITVRLFGVDREFTRDSDPASSIYWHQLSDDDNEFIDLLEEGPGWWSAHICIGEKEANFADYFAHGDSAQDAASKLEARMMPLAKLLSWQWREHVRQLETVVNCASHAAGVFSNETDEAARFKASSDLYTAVTEYEHWRWQQPAPELFPTSDVVTVRLTAEKTDE